MKTSFCCICRSSVKTLGSRTLLLEEKSLPQQDKPIYNALLDVMHDSPLPVCKRCCHRAIWNVREDLRNKASVTAVKTEIMSSLATFLIVTKRGRRTDWERFCDWARHLDAQPTDREIIEQFPSLFGRYAVSCRRIASELCQSTPLRQGELRPWQAALYARLQEDADDRTVEFFVDRDGGFGKSWFCGYLVGRIDGVQVLGPGKRDDLAHCVEINTHVFLFNVPRGSMQFLNYGLLENLKDRMVLSPKYDSKMKILRKTPHVIVFL